MGGDPSGTRSGWAARHWSPIIGAEHRATRAGVALFDLSPLGKIEVTGPGALGFPQRLTTGQLDRPVGSVTCTLMADERGGIRGDLTVTRLGQARFRIGCSGPLDLAWLRAHQPGDGSVHVRDLTASLCGLGVWGPSARDLLQRRCDTDLSTAAFPHLSARELFVAETPVLALRLCRVGEPGWELYTTPDYGLRLWDLLWETGPAPGAIAAGRGAFDSLRLEQGVRLWGVDVDSERNPYEAGLASAVDLAKGDAQPVAARGGSDARRGRRGEQGRACTPTASH